VTPAKDCMVGYGIPMMKQLATFWLAALFAVSPLTAEQQKPLGEQLRVRWDGFNVIVIKDGVKHPFNVQKDMKAYAIENVRLLSAKASGDFIYLLLDITAASRGGSEEAAQRECGVAEEESLIWLKVNQEFKEINSKSFPIESCWDGATPDHTDKPLTFDGSRLIVTGSTFRDPSKSELAQMGEQVSYTYTVEYSLNHPDEGLQVKLVRDEPR